MNKKNFKLKNLNSNINDNNNNNNNDITSTKGFKCIGPCYPPNTIYYHPLTLIPIKSSIPTCPIKMKEIIIDNKKKKIFADKCNDEDINKGYLFFDIFDDSVKIATSSDMFLKQIYNIKNITDTILYLNSSLDTLPLYSQKRILRAIFEVYYRYIEFPKIFFCSKLIQILKKIYKINNNLNEKKIVHDLDDVDSQSYDFYEYFIKKYT